MADSPKRVANVAILDRVLDRMGADDSTKSAVTSSIVGIIDAIDEKIIESGTSCVDWKDGGESSVVAAVGDGFIQMLRLGNDNQVRGDIWVIRQTGNQIKAGTVDAIDDHSNHEAMRLQALATEQHLKNIRDAQCMSQRLLGKAASDYQEPTVPEHLQRGM